MRVTKYGKRSEIENYVIWPMYIEQSEGKIQSAEISEDNTHRLKTRLREIE